MRPATLLLAGLCLLVAGCSSGTAEPTGSNTGSSTSENPTSLASDSLEKAVMDWAEWQYTHTSDDQRLATVHEHHAYSNSDEIMDTYEIAETDTVGNLAVALTRYSVGGDIFREHLWLLHHKNKWHPYGNNIYRLSSYTAIEDLPEGLGQKLETIRDKASTWSENSAKVISLEDALTAKN